MSVFRDKIRKRDNDWRIKDDYMDWSGLYVPLGNQDVDSSNSRIEGMLVKVLKGVDKIGECFKELRVDILSMIQKANHLLPPSISLRNYLVGFLPH